MQQRKSRRSVLCLFFFAVVLVTLTGAMAWAEYPEKPITLIVPWPPGGASDITPRSLVKIMSEELKQPIVVVNRPGAAAVVGTLEMERATPDGYTIGTYSYSQTLTNFTAPNPPHLANITPITKVMYSPATLTVTANFPANTLAEFIQYAKAIRGRFAAPTPARGPRPTSLRRPSTRSPGPSRRMFPSTGMPRRSPPWRAATSRRPASPSATCTPWSRPENSRCSPWRCRKGIISIPTCPR